MWFTSVCFFFSPWNVWNIRTGKCVEDAIKSIVNRKKEINLSQSFWINRKLKELILLNFIRFPIGNKEEKEPQAIDQFVGESRTVKPLIENNSWKVWTVPKLLSRTVFLLSINSSPSSQKDSLVFCVLVTGKIQKCAKSVQESCWSGLIEKDTRMNPIGKEVDGPTPHTEMDALLLGRTNVSILYLLVYLLLQSSYPTRSAFWIEQLWYTGIPGA